MKRLVVLICTMALWGCAAKQLPKPPANFAPVYLGHISKIETPTTVSFRPFSARQEIEAFASLGVRGGEEMLFEVKAEVQTETSKVGSFNRVKKSLGNLNVNFDGKNDSYKPDFLSITYLSDKYGVMEGDPKVEMIGKFRDSSKDIDEIAQGLKASTLRLSKGAVQTGDVLFHVKRQADPIAAKDIQELEDMGFGMDELSQAFEQIDFVVKGRSTIRGVDVIVTEIIHSGNAKGAIQGYDNKISMSLIGYALFNEYTLRMVECKLLGGISLAIKGVKIDGRLNLSISDQEEIVGTAPKAIHRTSADNDTVRARLKALKQFFEEGLITQEDYEQQKAKVLEDL